jgi:hypothetical protein
MKKNSLLYIVAFFAILGIIYSIFTFDKAFPIVNVKITADKNEILNKADSLSKNYALMDSSYRSVVAFDTDSRFKNYVELEGGGVEVFQDIVNKGDYHPYTWKVRQYNFNKIKECEFHFSPHGKYLGFRIILPDSLTGVDIVDPDLDDIINRGKARGLLIPDLSKYSLIENSSELKESGRRDHVFTYEMNDAGVEEALYRLKIGISGDKLTMVMPTVKIPDDFDRRYEEMRSANTTISFVGQAIMLLLYGVLGVGLAIFFMIRKRTLMWKPALKWSIAIGTLIFFAYLTMISFSWFSYDTSLSSSQFVFQQVFFALLNGLLIAVIFFVSSMAGEGLDRQAFPDHIQFWRSWSPKVGASKEIMRETIFGYLWAFFMVGFITFFYWLTNNVFNWWSPAENMVDPNVLALPMPWLLPAAQSLQAGFWEETLFRAVPLAGAILIAKKFKKKGLWIGFALLVQAAIFGSMHANYAQQPAYARIIEMLIPFVLYGLIYIKWGLLPVVISHFVYDIVLMALPIFLLSAPGIWIHRLMAIIAMLIPLIVVIYRRVKAGSWYKIKKEDLNSGYIAPEIIKEKEKKNDPVIETGTHKEIPIIVAVILIVLGALLWFFLTPLEQDVPKLNINRQEAIQIADAFILENNPGTDSLNFKAYVNLTGGIGQGGRFAWEHADKNIFKELYRSVLATNYFEVTYKTFEGDIVKKSETIDVKIGRDGEILAWFHNVPEPREGADLEEEEAKLMAEKAIEAFFGKSINELEVVKLVPEKRKARTDWSVIYRDTLTGLSEGDIRYVVSLSGDEVCGIKTKIHSTESWDREQKKANVLKTVLFVISKIIQFGLLVTVVILAIIAWTKKRFNVKLFMYFLGGFALIALLQGVLMSNMVIGQYPTSEPYTNLMLMLVISLFLGAVFSGFLYALPIGYMARIPLHVQRNEHVIGLRGASLGLVFAAVVAFAQGSVFKESPFVLDPFSLDTSYPILLSLLSGIEEYFVTFIRLMVPFLIADRISNAWQKKKVLTLVILFLSGFAYVGKVSLGWWLLGGSAVGLMVVILYIFVLRSNMIYIPVMAATIMILDLIQYLLIDPAVLTIYYVIVTSIVTVLLTVFAVWGTYRLRMLQPKKIKE